MDVQAMKQAVMLQEWSVRIEECRSSGKTVKAWSAQQGIAIKTYYYWEKWFVAEATRQMSLPAPAQGGQPIFVKGIECRLADGTIAGSVLKLNNAVKNLIDHTGMPVWEAVNTASLNPAKRIGMDSCKGSLENGKDADIAIFGTDFSVKHTILCGHTIFSET